MTLWFVLNALREQAGERKGLRPGGNYNEGSLSNQSLALEGFRACWFLADSRERRRQVPLFKDLTLAINWG